MKQGLRTVYFVSDHTGITAEAMGRSLLSQFEDLEYDAEHYPFVDSTSKVREVVAHINDGATRSGVRPLVFSTLVDPGLRDCLKESRGLIYDFFDTYTASLETELGLDSNHAHGRVHGMGNKKVYSDRIHAVNYALVNDDGAVTKNYPSADLVLLGVSRSGKTPTCLYLGLQYGILAANYPLTDDDLDNPGLPAAVRNAGGRLFGLTIDPMQLRRIRQERRPDGRYASLEQCKSETRKAEHLFKTHGIPFIDTTSMSIEEIATRVMQLTGLESRI